MIEPLALEERQARARAWLAQAGGPCRVKLCGMFREKDVTALNAARPDLCGFVHAFPKSRRNVSLEVLTRLAAQVDGRIWRVVVLVDQDMRYAADCARRAGIDIVQLHGHEDDDYIRSLRAAFGGGIIQALRICTAADVERALASAADLVLLDAGQGSGEPFDWSLADGLGKRRPYLLAGGLTPNNVAEAIDALHPWGVDMSSGIETDGVKDPQKMAAAVAAVRSMA